MNDQTIFIVYNDLFQILLQKKGIKKVVFQIRQTPPMASLSQRILRAGMPKNGNKIRWFLGRRDFSIYF